MSSSEGQQQQQQQQLLPTPVQSLSCSGGPGASHDTLLLPTPAELQASIPLSSAGSQLVASARHTINSILRGSDPRVLAIVGPCSIHDVDAAMEYAHKLKAQQEKLKARVFVVLRTYCEKPRTQEGWKGLVRDPGLDNTEDLAGGIEVSRALMVRVTNEVGLPCAAELLDPIVSTYFSDVLVWGAIGARTSESQVHRDLACAMEGVPIGFKNSTTSDTTGAIDSINAVNMPRSLLVVDPRTGRVAVKYCAGSVMPHLVLRGGRNGPNYFKRDVVSAVTALKELGLRKKKTHMSPNLSRCESLTNDDSEATAAAEPADSPPAAPELNGCVVIPRVLIDCSHGNSMKDYRLQQAVAADVAERISLNEETDGRSIAGIMLESNLCAGNQSFDPTTRAGEPASPTSPTSCQSNSTSTSSIPLAPLASLQRGVSITDSCIDLDTTWAVLLNIYEKASSRFGKANADRSVK